jgi:hypothetical protein
MMDEVEFVDSDGNRVELLDSETHLWPTGVTIVWSGKEFIDKPGEPAIQQFMLALSAHYERARHGPNNRFPSTYATHWLRDPRTGESGEVTYRFAEGRFLPQTPRQLQVQVRK